MLERAPLDAVGTLPAATLAAEGPALCAAVARGLGSDLELDRLRPSGDLAPLVRRIGPLSGAADAAATIAAVDALRACLWVAALDARAGTREAGAVGALAERLAEVTAVVMGTALSEAAVAADAPPTPRGAEPPQAAPPRAEPADHAAPLQAAPSRAEPPRAEPADAGEPDPERSSYELTPAPHERAADARNGAVQPDWVRSEREADVDLDVEERDEARGAHASVTPLPERPAIDPREGPAAAMDDSDLWIATLERHIDRCQREGGGLALLRVELVDGERVAASAPEGQAHVPYGRLAQAIRRAIRRQDLVASDHQGRAWVIAPAVGRAGALALAERIGTGVEEGEAWHGAPLAATIGFAVYGEDGRDAATLIDRAEEAMLAANAAGARIGEAIPQPEGAENDPNRPGPRLVR
ncbi:diguanylate cyclase domain-containing protein [Conexibacter sp. CPCC 206217]|uniref:diguanylate cyclase domain-containing protein n=1 Tax=Conexibacter sp. CPCC 206217 TaxID=3064574 RepID=UPI00272274D5|nr:diguanylate cyclase [Conexibacter sp. CPCC 206217]MDO8213026.1 diguanylate cyclase [Conexibacter sp. CPCC 206217]